MRLGRMMVDDRSCAGDLLVMVGYRWVGVPTGQRAWREHGYIDSFMNLVGIWLEVRSSLLKYVLAYVSFILLAILINISMKFIRIEAVILADGWYTKY
jgi:hypothetical protein